MRVSRVPKSRQSDRNAKVGSASRLEAETGRYNINGNSESPPRMRIYTGRWPMEVGREVLQRGVTSELVWRWYMISVYAILLKGLGLRAETLIILNLMLSGLIWAVYSLGQTQFSAEERNRFRGCKCLARYQDPGPGKISQLHSSFSKLSEKC